MKKRVGMYAWGGPGTIRLLETKYHKPKIDRLSYLNLYDTEYLSRAQELLGITDAWVTYSWGFSDNTEKEDYAFLRKKIPNFKKLGIRTHAYVQGLNLVTKDFSQQDLFCVDAWGKTVPYSKGRAFICPNNPNAINLISSRVNSAAMEDVNGVFVDNILFGLPPFTVQQDILPFFGCSCLYCQHAFKKQFGYSLPKKEKKEGQIQDYLEFRTHSTTLLIKRLSEIAQTHQKEFGINLYDPYLRNDSLYYGYKLSSIADSLDYYLIENHSQPSQPHVNNAHLLPLIHIGTKPTFVVSYKKGIGFERKYNQRDLDAISFESRQLGYLPCYKVTEYTTKGIWHALNLSSFRTVIPIQSTSSNTLVYPKRIRKSLKIQRVTFKLFQRYYTVLSQLIHENQTLWSIVVWTGVYKRQIRKSRMYVNSSTNPKSIYN